MNASKLTIIHKSWALAGLFLIIATAAVAEKTVITEADQLPRIAYPFEGNVIELLNNEAALQGFLDKARTEIERQLEEFDIQDNGTVRGYETTLRTLDFLEGDYESALERIGKIREMMEKPSDKLTSGLLLQSVIDVYTAEDPVSPEDIADAFTAAYAPRINALPWDVVQDDIESTNGSFQIISEALYLGGLENTMQNAVDQTGELSLGDVTSLASIRLMIDHVLPLKDAVVAVTSQYIAENRVEKPDIWADRDVDLSNEENLTPVLIAISDSGIDTAIFEKYGQMWVNENEVPGDGIDNDENGWVDDVNGIAWDLDSLRITGNLYPLSEDQLAAYPTELDFTKGLLDLQAAVDSEEAKVTRQRMANLKQEEYKDFVETLRIYGNYTHGTHVAGIAAAGNPAARLMNVRFTFGHEIIPDKPTIEEVVRSVEETHAMVDYLKAAGVRIVNMSWGGSQAGWEYALEANGVGDDPEQRAEIARILFGLSYDSLVEAMASAPEILFVPSAGNSDNDVEFNKIIPSSIDLPNVLVVGAVDQAGDETGFTSYGKNIKVHANGFEVESYVPGGRKLAFSGTSMSAPNVTNLAGKLLAIDPSLTPEEVISLILMGVDTTEDGRRHLINPKKSVALLKLSLMDI
jgi:subtilisin family serine protease